MKSTAFLIMLVATSLLACGKTAEEAAAPVPLQESARAQQAEQASVKPAELATPVIEPAPMAPPVETPAVQAASPKPAVVSTAPKAPVAVASLSAASEQPDLAHGQKIYGQACAFCHDKGVAGAPISGDAAAWSPRLAQGIDTLHASALHGKGVMPAKGGNPALADADVKAAVNYLAAQSR